MPRGMRAAHSSRGHATVSSTGGETFSMVVPEYGWLPASCWCEASIVWVTQAEVVMGVTRSCGGSTCGSEDGETLLGDIVGAHSIVAGVKVRSVDPLTTVEEVRSTAHRVRLNGKRARTRMVVSVEHLEGRLHAASDWRPGKVGRPPAHETASRRDLVRAAWMDNATVRQIAERLGVRASTVSNDLAWLRASGLA